MSTSVAKAFHHLAIAKHYFDDVATEHEAVRAGSLMKSYADKCNWCAKSFATSPLVPHAWVKIFKADMKSDVFIIHAIAEKLLMISPEYRIMFEDSIDAVANGEKLIVESV